MRCLDCNAEMLPPRQERFEYDCGLPGVQVEALVHRCPVCGYAEEEIPEIEMLHALLMVLVVLKLGRLSPVEFSFLRKQPGWSQEDLAKRGGFSAADVWAWEKGTLPIPKAADLWLRVNVLLTEPIRDYAVEAQDAQEGGTHPADELWKRLFSTEGNAAIIKAAALNASEKEASTQVSRDISGVHFEPHNGGRGRWVHPRVLEMAKQHQAAC